MALSHSGTESSRVESIRAIAEIERKLRGSSVYNVSVRFGGRGETARIGFDTFPRAEHFRGSISASVVGEIAASAWSVEHIHDPLEYVPESGEQIGEDMVGSMITIRLDGGESR